MTAPDLVLVRATAHLPDGILPGKRYWVDRNAAYIREALSPATGEPLLVLLAEGAKEPGDSGGEPEA